VAHPHPRTERRRRTARPGLTAQTAADILYALASPHTHQLLRRHCKWTTRRYRTWLVHAVTQQLLADVAPVHDPVRR
jgi:hypothetical protein